MSPTAMPAMRTSWPWPAETAAASSGPLHSAAPDGRLRGGEGAPSRDRVLVAAAVVVDGGAAAVGVLEDTVETGDEVGELLVEARGRAVVRRVEGRQDRVLDPADH